MKSRQAYTNHVHAARDLEAEITQEYPHGLPVSFIAMSVMCEFARVHVNRAQRVGVKALFAGSTCMLHPCALCIPVALYTSHILDCGQLLCLQVDMASTCTATTGMCHNVLQ